MLQIEDLYISFGEKTVLNGLSLDIESGKIYTLIGANGTGKTTLFNIITGFLKADKGTISYNGQLLISKSPSEINRLGIARTFQDLRLIKGISVRENILLSMIKKMRYVATYNEFKKAEKVLEQVSLLDYADNPANDLSYGQQKLLTLGCCLANNPDMFLLDEPVAGIDETNFNKIFNIVLELKRKGKTILQIEHNQDYNKNTSDTVLALIEGKIFFYKNYEDYLKST